MRLVHEHQKADYSRANPFRGPKTPRLPFVGILSRAAHYHGTTHMDAVEEAGGIGFCDQHKGHQTCHDVGLLPVKTLLTTTEFTYSDFGSYSFKLNQDPPVLTVNGGSANPSYELDGITWIRRVTNRDIDSIPRPLAIVTFWSNETTPTAASITAAFNTNCTAGCSGGIGNQNKELLTAQESGQYNAMGAYVAGRLAVVYMTKLSSHVVSEMWQCSPLVGLPAFNRRCHSKSRYDAQSPTASDADQELSYKLLTTVNDLLMASNVAMMKPPQWDEKSTQLAYYRTMSLSHMDACSFDRCSELDKVKWMSIRGVHSCATSSKGPPPGGHGDLSHGGPRHDRRQAGAGSHVNNPRGGPTPRNDRAGRRPPDLQGVRDLKGRRRH
eukprot:GHVU01008017.1.p1 GENE.GHVU01008017.1~~GHVU01008017.1.p1  ORF type:complete len:382 (-),score=30.80 GHVU01008017.1:288-1433(-)